MSKGLEHKFAEKPVWERTFNGIFQSLEEFVNRLEAAVEKLLILIRVGAFRFFWTNKKSTVVGSPHADRQYKEYAEGNKPIPDESEKV